MPPSSDLRQRILDTARALLDEGGVGALSLREVARRAGVTHQAPYHHFADRETIVAALVGAGFEALADALAAVNDAADGQPPQDTLVASGQAYVRFALDQPGVFRVMFRPEVCDLARFADARAAGERALGELQRMVRLVHGRADDTRASACWAQVHGLASLLLDGSLGRDLPDDAARLALAAASLRVLSTGVLSTDAA